MPEDTQDKWVKILDIQDEELCKLKDLGFKQLSVVIIYDIYYSHKAYPFRERGFQFRLREITIQGSKFEIIVEFALKAPAEQQDDDTFREMFKTVEAFPDFHTGERTLESLGFIAHTRRQKHRFVFEAEFDGQRVEIQVDKYPKIPRYAEVTGSKEARQKVIDHLGIKPNRISDKTASGIFRHYGIEDSTNMTFDEIQEV